MKSDTEIWLEYIKTVEKIEKPNIECKYENQKPVRRKNGAKKDNSYNAVMSYFEDKKKQNFFSHTLTRMERRRFKSETSIDFHGYNRNIEPILENFCLKCIVNNVTSITIISGKGGGIVKAAVKDWLTENSHIVYGFFEVKDSMGQSGAFCVRLRKK